MTRRVRGSAHSGCRKPLAGCLCRWAQSMGPLCDPSLPTLPHTQGLWLPITSVSWLVSVWIKDAGTWFVPRKRRTEKFPPPSHPKGTTETLPLFLLNSSVFLNKKLILLFFHWLLDMMPRFPLMVNEDSVFSVLLHCIKSFLFPLWKLLETSLYLCSSGLTWWRVLCGLFLSHFPISMIGLTPSGHSWSSVWESFLGFFFFFFG